MRQLMKQLALPWPENASALTTINDYAYYEFGLTAWPLVRVVFGLLRRFRALAAVCFTGAQIRWSGEARPHYAQIVNEWGMRDAATMLASDLVEGATAIVAAAAGHYLTIQSGILPVAYISEALFTIAYNRLAKRQHDEAAVTFMLGFDSAPILADKSLYDLAVWARGQPGLASHLARSTSRDVAVQYLSSAPPTAPGDAEIWRAFWQRLTTHLDRFGHAVYDLDFAVGLAADDPTPLIEAIKHFVVADARNPHQRQAAAAARRQQLTESLLQRLHGLRGRLFKRLLPWAQRYAPLREDALADVCLGWPVLRRLLLEMGRRLVVAGGIADRQDVFWLTLDEIAAAAQALDAGPM
jgi:rifampicin phosphotransferase